MNYQLAIQQILRIVVVSLVLGGCILDFEKILANLEADISIIEEKALHGAIKINVQAFDNGFIQLTSNIEGHTISVMHQWDVLPSFVDELSTFVITTRQCFLLILEYTHYSINEEYREEVITEYEKLSKRFNDKPEFLKIVTDFFDTEYTLSDNIFFQRAWFISKYITSFFDYGDRGSFFKNTLEYYNSITHKYE